MTNRAGALLLAAGFSRRFGSAKLLAKLSDGQTVFSQTLSRLNAAMPEIVVVTRLQLAKALSNEYAALAVFDQAERGMGASIAFGIGQIRERGWSSCLICLADMPYIQTATYRAIGEAGSSDRIVVPTYKGVQGNPVAFGSDFFDKISMLDGDSGGRPVLASYPDSVTRIPVEDSGIHSDIDTPAALLSQQPR